MAYLAIENPPRRRPRARATCGGSGSVGITCIELRLRESPAGYVVAGTLELRWMYFNLCITVSLYYKQLGAAPWS